MQVLDEVSPRPLRYGTGGFRGEVSVVRAAFARCGALAALRSKSLGGQAVGVMITASHNLEVDNGVKIVERDGRMLAAEWESLSETLVNARNATAALEEVRQQVFQGGHGNNCSVEGLVFVGRDTRASSLELASLVKAGAQALDAQVEDLGEVTTPELHYIVREHNLYKRRRPSYRARVADFVRACCQRSPGDLSVDCANGIGGQAMRQITDAAEDTSTALFNVGEGELNFWCGADFVQKQNATPARHLDARRSASIDGDADRLVYYQKLAGEKARVVDGGKILAFIVRYISERLLPNISSNISVGAVHTAYTNGACIKFMESLKGVSLVCAKTGVKHLEIEARKYDIGAYWEPNGHGTVLLRHDASGQLFEPLQPVVSESVLSMANQAVGDAIADLYMLESLFASHGYTFEDLAAVYDDFSCCNRVVKVRDKSVVRTLDDDEQRLSSPIELQSAIDELIATYEPGSRAFVRPSGTEDVVRVYVERPAGDREAEEAAEQICALVTTFCG
mmetsp:Transcript_11986/g.36511  ORF Transcript_11986/g.36511 Transcript_11986/m.36511 type:complete len:509 (-) Transcript_11986:1504-3030(-)